jgi:hypothetical protein
MYPTAYDVICHIVLIVVLSLFCWGGYALFMDCLFPQVVVYNDPGITDSSYSFEEQKEEEKRREREARDSMRRTNFSLGLF